MGPIERFWQWLPSPLDAFLFGSLALVALVVAFGLLRLAFPKVAAIALTSAKWAWFQPLFWVILVLGTLLLMLFTWVPYSTFGEDLKMFKETSLTLVMLFSIILAVWTASVSIGRRQFVFGKFLGVLAPAYTLFVLLSIVFVATISYKVVYDARENSLPAPEIAQIKGEMVRTVPPLVLAFFETVVLTSITIALSTRMSMLPNLTILFSIYVLGHLTPLLVQSSIGQLRLVKFMGQFIATVLPVLDHYKSDAAIAADRVIPWVYVGHALIYTLIYSAIMMLLSLLFFERRDLG
jgi:hypothetical protein